jgi:tetratricopeptide (TPR) repeat protein
MRWLAALAVVAALAFSACGGSGKPAVLITPSPANSPAPTREAPPLPNKPSDFGDIPAAVAQYLTEGGGSADCLQALFEAWQMPADGTTPCAAADLDGDGQDEYVVRMAREAEAPASPNGLEGTVLVFREGGGAYTAVFRLEDLADALLVPAAEGLLPDPAILAVKDVNGDGGADAALTSSQCGAHTCNVTFCLVASSAGAYASLIESPAGGGSCIGAPSAEDQVRFEDADGDGVSDLLFREGLVGSVGAGPQRQSLRSYRWDGERYALAGTEYEPSNLRYFKVRDADEALAAGDYQTAIKLYREAVNSPDLLDAESFGDAVELLSYARFRIGLALAQKGDSAAALTALDEAVAAEPDALHSQMAARFRQGYAKVKHTSPGCAAARDFVQANLDAFAALWDYGYANPEFDPDALCPF